MTQKQEEVKASVLDDVEQLYGKLIISLRSQNEYSTLAMLTSVVSKSLNNNIFTLYIKDQATLDKLCDMSHKRILDDAIKSICNIDIECKLYQSSTKEDKLEKIIKEKFKDINIK